MITIRINKQSETQFSESLNLVKPFYHELTTPDEEVLKKYDDILRVSTLATNTSFHVMKSLTLTILFLCFPFIVQGAWSFATMASKSIFPYLNQSIFLESNPLFDISVLAVLIFCFYQAFIEHIYVNYKKKNGKDISNHHIIDNKNFKFKTFQIISLLLIVFALLVVLNSYSLISEYVTVVFTTFIFIIPLIIVSVLPTLVLLIFALDFIFLDKQEANEQYTYTILNILEILYLLKDIKNSEQFTMKEREKVLVLIQIISTQISSFYENGSLGSTFVWTKSRVQKIANRFHCFSIWVTFPMEDSIDNLKKDLINYVNILLSGNLNSLPFETQENDFISPNKSKLMSFGQRFFDSLWIVLLVLLPILIYFSVNSFYHFNLPAALEMPAQIAYLIWLLICVIPYLNEAAPEAKNLLLDFLKTRGKSG